MKPQFLNNAKKKKLVNELEEQYGIEKLPFLVLETGKGKYRIYSGGLSEDEITELSKGLKIEIIGCKLCKQDNKNTRLNFDILNLPEIKKQISKNTIEISDEEANAWLKGEQLDKNAKDKATYITIKNNNDFLGIGQNSENIIKNYIPKERRIRR